MLPKRTYTLPQEVVEPFEEAVPTGRRSAVVANLMAGWLERRRQEQLRHEIVEGCREMAAEYLVVEGEFHALEEEVERAGGHEPPQG